MRVGGGIQNARRIEEEGKEVGEGEGVYGVRVFGRDFSLPRFFFIFLFFFSFSFSHPSSKK